jgi:predicted nucleotidyltransferase
MKTPKEITHLLDTILSELHARLSTNFVGLYLRGSLATGDFRPESSDVDLLAVTEREVSAAEFASLVELHGEIAAQAHPFATRLEITYIDLAALRRFQPGYHFPTLGQGEGEKLVWTEHHTNWILERWTVREHGVVLFGPAPKTLIDPIAPAEIIAAVQARVQVWAEWASDLTNPDWQLPRSHKTYVVETMCRALYTGTHGGIASKAQSVAWARQNLPDPWRTLVEESQHWHTDHTTDPTLILPVQAFVLWSAQHVTL